MLIPTKVLVITSLMTFTQVQCSLYNPHKFPVTGPFFEGWYIRVQDAQNNISLAVLFGSVLPDRTAESQNPLAYVGALKSHGSSQLASYSSFPKISEVDISTGDGQPITKDPDWTSPPGFYWNTTDHGYFYMNGNGTCVEFVTGSVRLTLQLGKSLPWGNHGEGPAGLLDAFPLPLHWFVYSLASPVIQYTWDDSSTGEQYRGRSGWAHQEKNWGDSFPEAWIWTQGCTQDASRIFALSYGPVGFGTFLNIPGHLFGYRNYDQDIEVNLTPANSVRTSCEFGCGGAVTIEMLSLTYRIRLEISASGSTFSDCLFGPMASGFRPVAVESYSSTAVLTVEKRHLYFFWKTIDSFTFTEAALEFGGAYVCNQKCT